MKTNQQYIQSWRTYKTNRDFDDEEQEAFIERALDEVREEILDEYGLPDDDGYKDAVEKYDRLCEVIKNRGTVYLSERGHVITEEDYFEFRSHAEIAGLPPGSSIEKHFRVDLSIHPVAEQHRLPIDTTL